MTRSENKSEYLAERIKNTTEIKADGIITRALKTIPFSKYIPYKSETSLPINNPLTQTHNGTTVTPVTEVPKMKHNK